MLNNFTKKAVGIMTLLLVFLINPLSAGPLPKFDKAKFFKAQKEGKVILVAAHADWCPTCRKQEPILEKLSELPAYKNILFFQFDFDKDFEARAMFRISHQTTLILFKGKSERGRSIGQTDTNKLRYFLDLK